MWRNGSVYNRHILNGSSVCLTCLWLHDAACQKSMQSDLQCKGTMKLFKGLASLGSIWQISQPVLNPQPLRVNRCHCRTSPGRAARNRCVFRSMASDRRIVQRLVFAFTVDESMNRWESSRNFTTCLRTTSKSVLELSVGNTGYPVGFQRQSFFNLINLWCYQYLPIISCYKAAGLDLSRLHPAHKFRGWKLWTHSNYNNQQTRASLQSTCHPYAAMPPPTPVNKGNWGQLL